MAKPQIDQTLETYRNLRASRLVPLLDGLTTTVVLGNGTTSLLTAVAVTSITGTANEIDASASTGAVTLSLPAALTFTGKTITGGTYASPTLTTPDINGGTADSLTSLSIRSTGAAFDLTFATAEAITAGRTLSWVLGNTARTITLSGSPTLADWFDQSVKIAASPTFAAVNATTFTGALSGNATTATTLQTARAIYGNNFDGSAALAQVIASTYGGTGNGFTKFTGPTTAEKTKTLRDATDTILELGGSYTPTGTWTSLTLVTPVLGTPASGTLTNCTFPTLNQNTTGSAASLSISGQTGLLTFTGLLSTNRAKTVRDAADTLLELGGSYTPTGTWTSLTLVAPVLGTPASGTVTNLTGTASININGTVGATTPASGSFTSLAASGAFTNSTARAKPAITSTTGTNDVTISLNNTGGELKIGREDSAGTEFGLAAYSSAVFSGGNYHLFLGANGVVNVLDVYSTGVAVTGTLAATGAVSGSNLSGTNTGDQTTITGNAGTATALQTARTIGNVSFDGTANIVPETIVIVDSTDATSFPLMVDSATGSLQPKTDAALTYNATTGALAATTFTGALSGNASTATSLQTARTIGNVSFDGTANIVPETIAVVDSTDATSFPLMVDSATGSLQPKTDAALTYDASAGSLAATTLVGATVRANTAFNFNGTGGASGTIVIATTTAISVSGGIITGWS